MNEKRSGTARYGWIAMLLFIGASATAGQEGPIGQAEWIKAHAAARKALEQNPHRLKLIIDIRQSEADDWSPYSYQEMEFIHPDRKRLRQFTGLKLEIIYIGKISYTKRPDGGWTAMEMKPMSTGATV